MKNALLGLFFLLFPVMELLAQMPENRVRWSEQPLTWNDFVGEPELQNPFDANTNSGISYSWALRTSEKGAEFLYKVDVFFYPDLSWVKSGKMDVRLLAHEQLHLNISELNGRKLRKAMAEYDPDLKSDIKKVLERIYQKNENARRQMQKKYDLETNHGQNEKVQLKWETFIKAEMAKLAEFSS